MNHTEAEKVVRQAEAVYRRRDIEATMSLYSDDAVIVWNGREVARGAGEVRAFHERFYDPSIRNVQLDKTLIAASGGWIRRGMDRKLGQSRRHESPPDRRRALEDARRQAVRMARLRLDQTGRLTARREFPPRAIRLRAREA